MKENTETKSETPLVNIWSGGWNAAVYAALSKIPCGSICNPKNLADAIRGMLLPESVASTDAICCKLEREMIELRKEVDLRVIPSPTGTIAARLNWWKQLHDELSDKLAMTKKRKNKVPSCCSTAIQKSKWAMSGKRKDGDKWRCSCGQVYTFVEDEAEGGGWWP